VEDIEEEEVDSGGDNLTIPKFYVGHNGAQRRGAMMSSDVALTNEAARQMGRQAIEVNTVVNTAANAAVTTVANTGRSRSDATMCEEITSNENAERDENWKNWPFCIKEIGRRSNEKSDSSSVESGGRRSPMELNRREINEQRRSIEDLRTA